MPTFLQIPRICCRYPFPPIGKVHLGFAVMTKVIMQRHVARALWHLATAEDSRLLLVQQGGLAALQRLVEGPDSLGQSRTLAHQV